MQTKKILITTFILIGSLLLINSLLLNSSCKTTVYSSHFSPSKIFVANIFDKDCGATTSQNKQIEIILNNQKESILNKFLPGIYGYLNEHKDTIFSAKGNPAITVNWKNDTHVHVSYSRAETIYTKLSELKTVTVTYSEIRQGSHNAN